MLVVQALKLFLNSWLYNTGGPNSLAVTLKEGALKSFQGCYRMPCNVVPCGLLCNVRTVKCVNRIHKVNPEIRNRNL